MGELRCLARQVKMVLRHFLITTGSSPMDMINAKGLVSLVTISIT